MTQDLILLVSIDSLILSLNEYSGPTPTVQYMRSDISPAGHRSLSPGAPPIITDGPLRINDQHLRHETAKPEPTIVNPQHISNLLPLFQGTVRNIVQHAEYVFRKPVQKGAGVLSMASFAS